MSFRDELAKVIARDPRFSIEGYAFVLESLNVARTLKLRQQKRARPRKAKAKKSSGLERSGHVTGKQLCEAARRLAVRHYGLLAPTVLAQWGIRSTSNIGDIVYNLIASGDLDRTPSDNRSDFDDVYEFATAFKLGSLLKDEDIHDS